MRIDRSHIGVVVLLLVALAIRVGYIWEIRNEPHTWAPPVDAGFHDQWAKRVAKGDLGDLPFFRAPLYPWLLGATYAVFGDSPFPPRILQALLSTLTVWFIWRIGRRLFGPTAGWISGIAYALWGLSIYKTGELLIETLFIFLNTVALWLIVKYYRHGKWWQWGLIGLVLGFSAIARPSILIFVPVLILTLWLRSGSAINRRLRHIRWQTPSSASSVTRGRVTANVVALCVGLIIPITPITLMNWIGGGQFALIATQDGINFYIGNNPKATGAHSILPEFGETWELSDAWSLAKQETGQSLNSVQLSHFFYDRAFKWMRHHPLDWLKLMARKTHLFIQYFEISNNRNIYFFADRSHILRYLIWFGFGIIAPIGILGMIVTYRHSPETRILTWFVISYSAGVILFFITARFRMPVVPAMIVLGSTVPTQISRWFKENRYRSLAMISVGAVVLFSLCWWNPYGYSRKPDAQVYFSLGNAYLKLKRYAEAREEYRTALTLDPNYEWVHLNIGVSFWRQGNPAEAEKEYRQELDFHPQSETAMNNLGVIANERGNYSEAEKWFRKALQVENYYDDARVNLAETLFQEGYTKAHEGNFKDAATFFSEAADLAPNRAIYRYNLAVMQAAIGNRDDANRNWELAHRIDPTMPPLPEDQPMTQAAPDSVP